MERQDILPFIKRKWKQPSTKIGVVVVIATGLLLFTNVTPDDINELSNNLLLLVTAITTGIAAIYDIIREEKVDDDE